MRVAQATGKLIRHYTHFFISTWTFWHEPSLSTYCAHFFRQKPSCFMCLIFLKKSLYVLIQPCKFHWTFGPKPLLSTNRGYFLQQKPLCAMCLFFWNKKPLCAYSAMWIPLNFLAKAFVLAKLCLWYAYFFRQKPSCAMCLILSKKKSSCA